MVPASRASRYILPGALGGAAIGGFLVPGLGILVGGLLGGLMGSSTIDRLADLWIEDASDPRNLSDVE
jgi:uncharacterized protein YqgC (DUF456 family)